MTKDATGATRHGLGASPFAAKSWGTRGCVLPPPGKSWELQGLSQDPAGISLEVSVARVALRRGHCAAWQSSLPGPEAVVMLLHPGYHIYPSDVQRPGGCAYRNQPNSSFSSSGPGHPSSCLQSTELMQQQRWDLQDSLPSGQFGCTNSLVALGPRSTWQRNSPSEELTVTRFRGHWTHKAEAALRLPPACRSHASKPTTVRGNSPGKG